MAVPPTPYSSAPPMGGHDSASLMMQGKPAAAEDPEAGWKVSTLSIEIADNGGVTVRCSKVKDAGMSTPGPNQTMGSSEQYKSKTYTYGDPMKALEYVAEELGVTLPAASVPEAAALPPEDSDSEYA